MFDLVCHEINITSLLLNTVGEVYSTSSYQLTNSQVANYEILNESSFQTEYSCYQIGLIGINSKLIQYECRDRFIFSDNYSRYCALFAQGIGAYTQTRTTLPWSQSLSAIEGEATHAAAAFYT